MNRILFMSAMLILFSALTAHADESWAPDDGSWQAWTADSGDEVVLYFTDAPSDALSRFFEWRFDAAVFYGCAWQEVGAAAAASVIASLAGTPGAGAGVFVAGATAAALHCGVKAIYYPEIKPDDRGAQ